MFGVVANYTNASVNVLISSDLYFDCAQIVPNVVNSRRMTTSHVTLECRIVNFVNQKHFSIFPFWTKTHLTLHRSYLRIVLGIRQFRGFLVVVKKPREHTEQITDLHIVWMTEATHTWNDCMWFVRGRRSANKTTRHRQNEFPKNFNSEIFSLIRRVGKCHFLPSLVCRYSPFRIVFLLSYRKMFAL